MRTTPRNLVRVAAIAAAALFAGQAATQACDDPKVLRFSLVPTQDSVRELTYYKKPILDLMQKNTGKRIEFYMPTSYSSVVEALLGKWVDVAVLGPESYVITKRKEPNVEVFATYHRAANGIQLEGPGYKAVLITKKGSRFTSVKSLKGSVLALVDPASTSGSLIPENVFRRIRRRPNSSSTSRASCSRAATTCRRSRSPKARRMPRSSRPIVSWKRSTRAR